MTGFQLEPYQPLNTVIHRLDARLKLLVWLSVLVSGIVYASPSLPQVLFVSLLFLLALTLGKASLTQWLYRVVPLLVIFGFSALGLLIGADPAKFITLVWVTFLFVTVTYLLTAFTRLGELIAALSGMKFLSPVIALLTLAHRYLFVCVHEIQRVVTAYRLRAFNQGLVQSSIGFVKLSRHILIKTYDKSDRIADALVCRGFDGHFRILPLPSLTLLQSFLTLLFIIGYWVILVALK